MTQRTGGGDGPACRCPSPPLSGQLGGSEPELFLVVIDESAGWLNLARRVIEESVADYWLVDLAAPWQDD